MFFLSFSVLIFAVYFKLFYIHLYFKVFLYLFLEVVFRRPTRRVVAPSLPPTRTTQEQSGYEIFPAYSMANFKQSQIWTGEVVDPE